MALPLCGRRRFAPTTIFPMLQTLFEAIFHTRKANLCEKWRCRFAAGGVSRRQAFFQCFKLCLKLFYHKSGLITMCRAPRLRNVVLACCSENQLDFYAPRRTVGCSMCCFPGRLTREEELEKEPLRSVAAVVAIEKPCAVLIYHMESAVFILNRNFCLAQRQPQR